MADSQQSPIVADHEFALRAVLCREHWYPIEDRPSTALFDYDYFSVDIKSRTTIDESVSRMVTNGKTVLGLIEFNCGHARELGFESRDELDPEQQENLSHAHVYNLEYGQTSRRNRKKKIKRLIEICTKLFLVD